jgi:hypothetical protein
MPNSHIHEYVKEQIENEGYKLLGKEYKNVFTKLKIKCPEGHEYNDNVKRRDKNKETAT